MKTIIIEDEYVAAQSLQRLIASVNEKIEVLNVLQSVEESIEWFSTHPTPELVFMDIHLADGSSFSIFEKVNIGCPVIFTTAYDEYALKAFEVNSIDYLLKPISRKSLERALDKLRSLSSNPANPDWLSPLMESLKQEKAVYKSHFLIPHRDKLIPLATNKIAYIYSEYKMAKIVTHQKETYTLDISLDEISRQLDPLLFFRANRQYILSHRAVDDISIWFNGRLSINLTLPAPDKIIVSRARVQEFKDWFTKNYD